MAERQRAEPLGEGYLPGVIEALVAQEDHLVVEQRVAYLGYGIVAEHIAGVDAGDLGADVAASLMTSACVFVLMVSVTGCLFDRGTIRSGDERAAAAARGAGQRGWPGVAAEGAGGQPVRAEWEGEC